MRTRRLPGQMRLLVAGLFMILGGWLPWVYTSAGVVVIGAVGAGLWVFYAGLLAVAGGLLPRGLRTMALVQAVLVGVVAIALPVWQLVHLWNLVGFEGWAPGPGLALSIMGGALALIAARQLAQPAPVPAETA